MGASKAYSGDEPYTGSTSCYGRLCLCLPVDKDGLRAQLFETEVYGRPDRPRAVDRPGRWEKQGKSAHRQCLRSRRGVFNGGFKAWLATPSNVSRLHTCQSPGDGIPVNHP